MKCAFCSYTVQNKNSELDIRLSFSSRFIREQKSTSVIRKMPHLFDLYFCDDICMDHWVLEYGRHDAQRELHRVGLIS